MLYPHEGGKLIYTLKGSIVNCADLC